MIKFPGKILQSQLWLPRDHARLRRFKIEQWEGKEVWESIWLMGKNKSWNQVKMHFGLCVQLIRERMDDLGMDIFGIVPNKEMIHEILIKCCGGVGEDGATVRLSDMTTSQAAVFFENIRAWAATQLHLVIPDPDPRWKEAL